jgi:hypothetical protein
VSAPTLVALGFGWLLFNCLVAWTIGVGATRWYQRRQHREERQFRALSNLCPICGHSPGIHDRYKHAAAGDDL